MPDPTLELEVVILGGGFAGVYCAKALIKSLGKKRAAQSAIISDENYMVFQPMLPDVAGAELSPRHVVSPIRTLCRGLQVYRGKVKAINVREKSLVLSAGSFSPDIKVHYQHLVLTLGATIDLSRVPGMPEHAFLMQNVGDAMKLRATVLSRFEEANLTTSSTLRKRMLSFVIVGGGYSGVETAGQLLDLFHTIHKFFRQIDGSDFSVSLVHSREHLLPTLSQSLGDYAENKLRKRGLKIFLQRRVKAVTANVVYLDNGETIETSTVVSTVGNAPHPLVLKLCQEDGIPNTKGRINTLDTMQIEGQDNLWACGDCAAVPFPGGGICPPTAQFAMRQGALLGENIADVLKNQGKPLAFTFRGLGELASIGHRSAVANILGLRFSGFIAWWMWRTIYLMKLPGIDRKLRVMMDWTLDLFFPRDINLLNPRYSHSLKDVYLTETDILFHAGEPAFSFYVLKSGRIDIMDGDELIKTIRPGDFFGERALLEDEQWRYTAVAREPSNLVSLAGEDFKAVMTSSETFRKLLSQSAQTYRTTDDLDKLKKQVPLWLLRKPVFSLMKSEVFTLHRDMRVVDALNLMKESRHSLYPVVNPENNKLQGVFNRDDFYDFLMRRNVNTESTLESMEMDHNPQIHPESMVEEALEVMVRSGKTKLLITEEGVLKGVFSIMDILEEMKFLEQANTASFLEKTLSEE